MDLIFAIGTFQALFMVLLVITKKNRSRADIPLILYLILISIHLIFYMYLNNNNASSNFLTIWATGFPLLYGPLMYFYILGLIVKKSYKFIWYTKHLVIFVIWGFIYNLPNFFDLSYEISVQNGFLTLTGSPPSFMYLFSYTAVLSGGGYSIWNLLLLHKYRKNLKFNHSSIDRINLNWVSNWAYLFLYSFVVIFAVSLMPVSQYFIKIIIATSITAVVTYIGFSGYKQTSVFFDLTNLQTHNLKSENNIFSKTENPDIALEKKPKYSKSLLSAKNKTEIVKKLEYVMAFNKSYLKDDLSLQDLAEEIGISRQLLSQLINDDYKKTFYEFVNDFRVKEAQKLMEEDSFKNLKIAAIGYDAGFRSRSTFYKFFKKNTGLTPVEYRKKLNS